MLTQKQEPFKSISTIKAMGRKIGSTIVDTTNSVISFSSQGDKEEKSVGFFLAVSVSFDPSYIHASHAILNAYLIFRTKPRAEDWWWRPQSQIHKIPRNNISNIPKANDCFTSGHTCCCSLSTCAFICVSLGNNATTFMLGTKQLSRCSDYFKSCCMYNTAIEQSITYRQ